MNVACLFGTAAWGPRSNTNCTGREARSSLFAPVNIVRWAA